MGVGKGRYADIYRSDLDSTNAAVAPGTLFLMELAPRTLTGPLGPSRKEGP